jgi:hypothetical protein
MKFILIMALSFAFYSASADDAQPPTTEPTATDAAIDKPVFALPMRYVSSVSGDELFDALKKTNGLSKISKELYGSPIVMRSTLEKFSTAGGSASTAFSAMLAGGSLGILPVVTNNDFILRYDILVNSEIIFEKAYIKNMTDAVNMFAQNSGKMDPEILEWVLSTAPEINQLVNSDENIEKLVKEYLYYFPIDEETKKQDKKD